MARTPQAAAADFAKTEYRSVLADYKAACDNGDEDEAVRQASRVIAKQEAHIAARLTDFNNRITSTLGLAWPLIGPRKDRLKSRLGQDVYQRHHHKGKK